MRDTGVGELHEGGGQNGGALPVSERVRAWRELSTLLEPGDEVYTKVNHVSRSGMTRFIDLYVFRDNRPLRLSWSVATVLGWTYSDKHDAVKVEGCGMDMGFHLVYSLGRVLFPDGFKVDGIGRNGDTSGWDNDGGYALRQRWL